MNKTKIEWTDYTWNPITGCLHGCWYCYAKKMFTRFHRSFEPTFHPERLDELAKLKKPSRIFVCSVADLFAKWTPSEWTEQVLNTMKKYPHHEYQLLTKESKRGLIGWDLHNYWLGITINNQSDMWKLNHLSFTNAKIKFASFEPLLGEIKGIPGFLDWIIIGKLTGSRKVPLQKEWVESIISEAREKHIPVFVKNNVQWCEKIQEFPKGVK